MITQMKNKLYRFLLLLLPLLLVFSACQKEISVDLPEPKQKICVEGKIEPGLPPYVILTHNMPYFGPTDISAIQNMFIHNAEVKINGVTLTEYCSKNLPPSLDSLMAVLIGRDTASLENFNYCLYTTLNTAVWGTVGSTYDLTINAEGKTLTSTTKILTPIPLDSVWHRYLKANDEGDSLGFVFAHLTDPPAEGDCYRWLTMRKGKDFSFIPPSGSAFDDKYINGQSFDFAYNRGHLQNSQAEDDNNEEHGYFKIGDTVIVKYCTIDNASFKFFRDMDVLLNSEGNPFASPASVPSNVYPREEALGVWCGYGVHMDTVIFK